VPEICAHYLARDLLEVRSAHDVVPIKYHRTAPQ